MSHHRSATERLHILQAFHQSGQSVRQFAAERGLARATLERWRKGRDARSRAALFVFIGKRRQTLKALWWDGTGTVLCYKRLDSGVFEIPRPEREGDASVVVSDAAFDALLLGLRRSVH